MNDPASRSDVAASPADALADAPSADAAGIRLVVMREGRAVETAGPEALAALEVACRAKGPPTAADKGTRPARDTRQEMLWIDLADADEGLVQEVARTLGLHPLIAEDVIEGKQRSKIEVTDGVIHIVIFAFEAGEPERDLGIRAAWTSVETDLDVHAHEVDLVIGDGYLLSAHAGGWDPRRLGHLKTGLDAILKDGPDHLLWAIIDGIVDGYFPFADRLEDLIDRLQDDVVDRPNRRTLERLFGLKRDLIAVRRAVSPVREILNQVTNRDLKLIDPEEILYFRDVYDHVIRLADELDTDRELVAATVEIYLSTINNNLSTIMKRLTGVTVILAGVGAVAGIFGMSEAGLAFKGDEAGGFWLVTAFVVAIAVVAAVILRRIDWI